ncbi:MAG: hypothetical protein EPO42_03760 [Gallionellaceae bacterium]|nr:MAG: hypothetical protein EPO42_03760 [Gallionellaceae bacterium]
MSHTLSQPEEVDLVLMEMAWNNKVDVPAMAKREIKKSSSWEGSGSYVSPYRAMHMKCDAYEIGMRIKWSGN